MILLIEPQCQGFAHEQFNAGIIFGYCLAYPKEKKIFFAETEHLTCVQSILKSSGIEQENIEYKPVKIPDRDSLNKPAVIFNYALLLRAFLNYAKTNNCRKIVFLSIYSFNLIPLKILLKLNFQEEYIIHIFMHGTLEFIKRENSKCNEKILKSLHKYLRIRKKDLQPGSPKNHFLYERLFRFSIMFLSNKNINYYVLRDDSLLNLRKYLPIQKFTFKSIDHPTIYKVFPNLIAVNPDSKRLFATLGQSNYNALKETFDILKKDESLNGKYEILIIGGYCPDNQSNNVLRKIKGDKKSLTRNDIEFYIKDVDFILFLYNEDSYELSTSGAFFDAIAYKRPIIFLKNTCFDYYFQNFHFGIRCNNIEELVFTMKQIISMGDQNYSYYIKEIERMQNATSITNNYMKLLF
jgi:hypothetical protein